VLKLGLTLNCPELSRAYLVIRDCQVGFEFVNAKKKPAAAGSTLNQTTDSRRPTPDARTEKKED